MGWGGRKNKVNEFENYKINHVLSLYRVIKMGYNYSITLYYTIARFMFS